MSFLARVSYTSNGSTPTFSFSFPYIALSHIKAFVDGVEDTNITFPTPSSLTLSSTPTSGAVVTIQRITPTDLRLTDFQDGSVLTSSDLDQSADQNFYIAQETKDDVASNLSVNASNVYDAGNRRIINVANPINNQDVVTKYYLENVWLSTSDKANINTLAPYSSQIGLLGVASVINDMDILGTSANVANIATVASNITDVNSFANRYRITATNPTTSLDAGDLAFVTGDSVLRYYDGTAWKTLNTTEADITSIVAGTGLSGGGTSGDITISVDSSTHLASNTTSDLAEGTNLYYTSARANADFDTRLATKSTSDLSEGTNLYYTDARFDTRLGTKSTSDLTEGSNLYYTDARADARVNAQTGSNLSLSNKTTSDLAEGSNLYYTDARVDTYVSGGSLSAIDVAGNAQIDGNLVVDGNLTVSGTQTIVNTETINLADNQIVLNSNFTGATPTEDGGIEIERGTQPNKTLVWDESDDKWTVGSETFVAGTLEGNLTGTFNSLNSSQFTRRDATTTQTGNINMTDSSLGLINTSASKNWTLQNNSSGAVQLTVGGTGGAEFEFRNTGSSYTDAQILIGGQRVLTIDDRIDEDNMASNSALKVPSQQSVKAYVDSQVATADTLSEVLANGNTTSGNHINFGDNDKAIFGDSNDLQIYHTGSLSYIDENGTGELRIQSNFLRLVDRDNNATTATFDSNGVNLRYQDAIKFTTTSTGAIVSGNLTATGNLTVTADSSSNAVFVKGRSADDISTFKFLSNDGQTSQLEISSRPTTGIFNHSTDTSFRINNTEVFGLDSSTVKVNETGADVDFIVEGTSDTDLFHVNAGNNRVGIGGVPTERLTVIGANNTSASELKVKDTDGRGILIESPYSGNGVGFIGTDGTNSALGFKVNSTEIARFGTNGYLGIGTTSPTDELHINTGDGNNPPVIRLEAGGGQLLRITGMGNGSDAEIKSEYGLVLKSNIDDVHINTGSTERVTVKATSGKVGIGTSSPDRTLHVKSATEIVSGLFESGASTNQVRLLDSTTTSESQAPSIGTVGDELTLSTNGAERLRIDEFGRVGIGKTNPTAGLEIGGDGNSNVESFKVNASTNSEWFSVGVAGAGIVRFNSQGGSTRCGAANDLGARMNIAQLSANSAALAVAGGFANNILEVNSANSDLGGDVMVIDQNGKVGIGTTSPTSTVDIRGANGGVQSRGILYLSNNDTAAINNGSQISLGGTYSGTNDTFFAAVAGRKENSTSGNFEGYLQFSTRETSGNNERMRITSTGNVGIGTTSPSSKLDVLHTSADVASFIRNNNSGSGQIKLGNSDGHVRVGGQNGSFEVYNSSNTSARLFIDNVGNVGLGNNTSPSSLLHLSSSDPQITITDTDGTGSQIIKADGNDLVLDSPGNIIFDAFSNSLIFKDNGQQIGTFANFSTGFGMQSSISDNDIIFRGNDNGVVFTALTLDMSEAGAATFNSDVTVNGNLNLPSLTSSATSGDVLTWNGTNITFASASSGGASDIDGLSDAIYDSSNNMGLGSGATDSITTGVNNIGIGLDANTSTTTGNRNIAIGNDALKLNNGWNNVAVGSGAGQALTSGDSNVFLGFYAGKVHTNKKENIAIGAYAMSQASAGQRAIAIGRTALTDNQADGTIGIGYQAGANNTTGTWNTYIGYESGFNATTAYENCMVGMRTGYDLATGGYNTLIGTRAGENVLGSNNTLIGWSSGSTLTTGSNVTTLGYDAEPSSATATNEVTLGNTNVDIVRTAGSILPFTDNAQDLGSSSLQWQNIYTGDLHLSNERHKEGNSVDGTTGNWTIQEGADNLYIINNKNGKKFKFCLKEIE